MIRNLSIMIIGMLMITSCYTKHDHDAIAEPVQLISQEKIVLILADIEIIESSLRQKQNHGHEIDDLRNIYYKSIFANYEVSKEQFDSSMLFYRQDMKTIDQIYEEVITRLSVIESEVKLEREKLPDTL